jgi:hypothetical protein
MTPSSRPQHTPRPVATPIILFLIAASHLAYLPLTQLRSFPFLAAAFGLSILLGCAYAVTAWLARKERGYRPAVSLIVAEDLGVLTSGLVLGYPWAEFLRPGTVVIVALQLALAFAEIVRRQEAGRPIVPASRLAWFVVAYTALYAGYTLLKPGGLWSPALP